MLKYIIKRILISIIVLLGVSIIIYTMVRLMPNDYVDTKFSTQLQQGTITQEDIDNFKSLYGLYCPEAQLTIKINLGSDYDGNYTRDVKKADYDQALIADKAFYDFVVGSTKSGKYKNGDYTLVLSEKEGEEGSSYHFVISAVSYETLQTTVTETDSEGNTTQVEKTVKKQKTEEKASGTFTVSAATIQVTLIGEGKYSGMTITDSTSYHIVSFGERFKAILGGYFTWLGNLLKGDMGYSFMYERPVAEVITEYMWISFAIAIVATLLQFLISIPLGISSATHQYSARDYLVTIFTMIGLSLPTYFFAKVAIKIFSVDLGWLPVNGLISGSTDYAENFAGQLLKFGDILKHLILPIFVSVILSLGGLMRYTRTNTLEVLSADYIRTARAKGLSEKTVIYKHAFRNTLIPLATLLAGILPSLFGGMMITEQVFGIDGIGNLAYKALMGGDIPFIMGYNMFLAILTVIGTLLSDIMYSIVDPRVKLGK